MVFMCNETLRAMLRYFQMAHVCVCLRENSETHKKNFFFTLINNIMTQNHASELPESGYSVWDFCS